MEWLNYHHVLYFWLVVREGGVTAAAKKLRLAHPTVSGQIKALEESLGEKLLVRRGRSLVMTEVGRVVYGYADEIFGLGQELLDTVKGRPSDRPMRLRVGVAENVPKLIARQLLDPALHIGQPVRLVCREDKADRLIAALSTHELDVVLTDAPLPPSSPVRAFDHLLGESDVWLLGTPALAAQVRDGLPGSLDGAPMLLPTEGTALRRGVDGWLDRHGVRPRVVAEFDDSALLKAFAQDGLGVFAAPAAVAEAVCRQHHVEVIAPLDGLRERYYAISAERRLVHPAVVAIREGARAHLRASG